MLDGDVVVAVPGLALAVPDLDVADPALQEAAGDEELAAVDLPGPYISRTCSGSLGDVEGVAGLGLHAEGQLERLDAGLEVGLAGRGGPRGRGSIR